MLPSHLSNIDFPIGLFKKVTTPSRPGRPPHEYSPLSAQQTARIAAQQRQVLFPPPETQDSLKGDTENLPSQQGSFPEAGYSVRGPLESANFSPSPFRPRSNTESDSSVPLARVFVEARQTRAILSNLTVQTVHRVSKPAESHQSAYVECLHNDTTSTRFVRDRMGHLRQDTT